MPKNSPITVARGVEQEGSSCIHNRGRGAQSEMEGKTAISSEHLEVASGVGGMVLLLNVIKKGESTATKPRVALQFKKQV